MVRQFIRLMLVPLLLASQGMAHAHHGIDGNGPDEHASHPHFHAGGHSNEAGAHVHDGATHASDQSHGDHSGHAIEADENDAAVVRADFPLGEHDSDAVYRGDSGPCARDSNSTNAGIDKDAAPSIIACVAHQGDAMQSQGLLCGQLPLPFFVACPIYLRTLALRI